MTSFICNLMYLILLFVALFDAFLNVPLIYSLHLDAKVSMTPTKKVKNSSGVHKDHLRLLLNM